MLSIDERKENRECASVSTAELLSCNRHLGHLTPRGLTTTFAFSASDRHRAVSSRPVVLVLCITVYFAISCPLGRLAFIMKYFHVLSMI